MNTELKFHYPHPPTSEEAIAAFEKELGYRLPEDYRQFLLKYNGGEAPNHHKFAYKLLDGGDTRNLVETFFGIDLEEKHKDIRRNQKHRFQGQPDYFFAIGYAGGSVLGMGVTEETLGKIYVWELTISDDILLVVNSFNEFLDMLKADR